MVSDPVASPSSAPSEIVSSASFGTRMTAYLPEPPMRFIVFAPISCKDTREPAPNSSGATEPPSTLIEASASTVVHSTLSATRIATGLVPVP